MTVPGRWMLMAVGRIGAAASVGVDPDTLVAQMFDQQGVSLVRMARLFIDDRNAAEDLVQEAFIRLHKSAHRIRSTEKAASYLRSIVISLARDHNRRGLISLRHQEAVPAGSKPDVPENLLILDEQQVRILGEVRAISPRQRDCIFLCFYLDLSDHEIADRLGISRNSVKTHIRRGMASLRATIGGEL